MQMFAHAPTAEAPVSAPRSVSASWRDFLRSVLCGTEGISRAARLALAGSLAGVFLFHADWMRVAWLTLAAVATFLVLDWRATWQSARHDLMRRLGMHFLCWMTFRSLIGYGMVDGDSGMVASGWLGGSFLLAVFSTLIWLASRDAAKLEALGLWTGVVAACAALISFVAFYALLPGHVFGERLMNALVYGGWNPVSSGLTFGFAVLWLVCLRDNVGTARGRFALTAAIVVLVLAVCFTRSRGALLALLAGLAILAATRGVRRMRGSLIVILVCVAAFACSGPLVERMALWQAGSHETVAASGVAARPVSEMVARWDAGRFELYERTLKNLTGLERWLFGIGQWGPEEACCRSLSRLQYHLHSAYFATFIHGGFVGLALLGAVLTVGYRRACGLARSGQDTWLALLGYGCVGLLFDGQTFTSFTSIPQMETLLVAFPLVAASSIWWHQAGGERRCRAWSVDFSP